MGSPAIEPQRQPATDTKAQAQDARPRQQPLWNVILLDDDDHSYEYVIRMMQSLFGHSPQRGYKLACEVDGTGRAVCATYHKELAELKQEQIHSFGRDPLMACSAGAMSAVIEPAIAGGEDPADGASGGESK